MNGAIISLCLTALCGMLISVITGIGKYRKISSESVTVFWVVVFIALYVYLFAMAIVSDNPWMQLVITILLTAVFYTMKTQEKQIRNIGCYWLKMFR